MHEAPKKAARITWLDSWRGLLIVLMALGHIFGGASHLCPPSVNRSFSLLYKAVYLFHMPAFFVLAGLVWRTPASNPKAFAAGKIRRLVIPYFVFAFFSWAVFAALSGMFQRTAVSATDAYYANAGNAILPFWTQLAAIVHAGGWPNDLGFKINSVLWFPPCLFAIHVAWFLLARFFKNTFAIALLAVSLLVASAFIPRFFGTSIPWGGRGRIAEFFFFFLLGHCLRSIATFPMKPMPPIAKLSFAVMAVAAAIALARISPNMYVKALALKWHLVFTAIAIVLTAASALVARLFDCAALRHAGLASMTIMLVHKWPLMALQMKVPPIRALFGASLSAAVFGCAIVLAGTIAASLVADKLLTRYAPWAIGAKRGRSA